MKRTLPTPSISHWQIAADGIWEDAKELSVNATPDETQKILLWIDSVGEDIAIEAFFGNKLSDNFGFFGARLSSLSKQEQKSFVQKLVGDVTDSDHFETVSDKFEQILTSFIHKESQKKIFDRPLGNPP